MSSSDNARLERLTAKLVKVDPSSLHALEQLLEILPEAPSPQNVTKQRLLRHYAERDPQSFYQLDAFTQVVHDDVFVPDDEGDCVSCSVTQELMSGAYALRVLITAGTSKDEAVRLLSKATDAIRGDVMERLDIGAQFPAPFEDELPDDFWGGSRLPPFNSESEHSLSIKVLSDEEKPGSIHDEGEHF